jgi:hypothetical protein
MATATARAPEPCNEKGRPVAGRPFGSLNIYGDDHHTTHTTRAQYLHRRLGLPADRAELVGLLAWGELA